VGAMTLPLPSREEEAEDGNSAPSLPLALTLVIGFFFLVFSVGGSGKAFLTGKEGSCRAGRGLGAGTGMCFGLRGSGRGRRLATDDDVIVVRAVAVFVLVGLDAIDVIAVVVVCTGIGVVTVCFAFGVDVAFSTGVVSKEEGFEEVILLKILEAVLTLTPVVTLCDGAIVAVDVTEAAIADPATVFVFGGVNKGVLSIAVILLGAIVKCGGAVVDKP